MLEPIALALWSSLHRPRRGRCWRRDAVVGYLARAGAVQPRATELGRVGGKTHIGVTWT